MKHLLLLGDGPAHLHVLKSLARERLAVGRVSLVAPSAEPLCAAMLPRWVAGRAREANCRLPLAALAHAAGADFIEATVQSLDLAERSLQLSNGSAIGYDALSLDIAPEIDREALPGASELGLFVHPLQHFSQLWPRLRALAEARPLCIVVIGGDALAVELAFALERALGRDSRISLVSGSGGLLPDFAERARHRVQDKLRQRRITLFGEDCVRIEAQQILLASGLKLACDAPVIAGGAGAPAWLRDSGLALAADGRVEVDELLRSRSHPDVLAANGGLAGREAAGAGEGLAVNLRRQVAGGVLQPQRSSQSAVRWLSFSDGQALALRGRRSATARWASWWKDYADHRYMAAWRVKAAGLPKKLPAVDKSEER